METVVRSKGLAWSSSELLKMRDELEKQVPGDGAMCGGVGITKRRSDKRWKRTKKRKSPKPAEEMACGVGGIIGSRDDGVPSSGEGGNNPAGPKKQLRLSQELLEFLLTREVMGYMATETPRPTLVRVPQEMFDRELKEEIAAEFKENTEFDAHVLFQYRTKGYAEIQFQDEELTDDDEVDKPEKKRKKSVDRPKLVGEKMADDGAMCGPSDWRKKRKKKKKKEKLFPEVVDMFLREELVQYMLSTSLLPAHICSLIENRKVTNAKILRQYRTNGYVNTNILQAWLNQQ